MTLFITNATAIAACNAVVDRCEGGTPPAEIWIYDGSVPADADTAIAAQTILAKLVMSNPAFLGAADASPGATADADTISDEDSALADGTATFFRVVTGTANTVLWQGAVGTTGEELNLNTTAIVTGATVSISSMTVTMPES